MGFGPAARLIQRYSIPISRLSWLRKVIDQRMASTGVQIEGADRIKGLEKSVWVEFAGMAQAHGALNIGQGFPDFPPPEFAMKALETASGVQNYMLNQYTRGFGHPRLVNALARMYSLLLKHEINPLTEVLITVGAYQALFYSVFGLLSHGQEAIIIEPYYDCYEPQVRMAGGIPKFVSLRLQASDGRLPTSADLKLDFDELERAFSPKTKILFLNNPNNPAGKVFTQEELEKIAALAKKYNVVVLADEVYEWLVYEGGPKMIRFASLPGMWERTITIGSAGKTFSVTGWKTGWAIGPANIMKHLQAVHQNCVYTCPTPLQEALAVGLELETGRLGTHECYFNEISKLLRPKREWMMKFLTEAGMKPIVPDGGYFVMADYSALKKASPFNEDQYGEPDEPKDYKFVRWLCKEKKLGGIPPSAFYSHPNKKLAENYIRFCFFKKDETLAQAEKIIKEWQPFAKQ